MLNYENTSFLLILYNSISFYFTFLFRNNALIAIENCVLCDLYIIKSDRLMKVLTFSSLQEDYGLAFQTIVPRKTDSIQVGKLYMHVACCTKWEMTYRFRLHVNISRMSNECRRIIETQIQSKQL